MKNMTRWASRSPRRTPILGVLVVAMAAGACGSSSIPELAAASATADDTFDPAFYDPEAGSFPALDDPLMVAANEAEWLSPDDIVMGIFTDTESRAFPVDQMAYHHVANTQLAGEPFVVTY